MYKSLEGRWKYFQSMEDDMEGENAIVHSWTKDNEYEIIVTDDCENGIFSISFESDSGRVENLHILQVNKDLFKNEFGLDLTECIDHAITWQHENQLN